MLEGHDGPEGVVAPFVACSLCHFGRQPSQSGYRRVKSAEGDLLYLDPPYRVDPRNQFYSSGMINFPEFFRWLRCQNGEYLLSLNGLRGGDDCSVEVPEDLYDEHVLIPAGKSSLARLNGNAGCELEDSLYVRIASGSAHHSGAEQCTQGLKAWA